MIRCLTKMGTMLLLLGILLLPYEATAQEMTLRQCLEKAMKANVRLNATEMNVDIAEAQRNSIRGRFLPVVKVEGQVIRWDGPLEADLGMDPLQQVFLTMVDKTPMTLADLAPLSAMAGPLTLREQVTYGGSVTIAQPLMQLYQISAGYMANDQMMDAARQDTRQVRLETQLQVAQAFYGLITANKMRMTAEAGLKQVEAYEKQIKAFMDAGMVERNALLKVQVQKADIQKGLFQAEKGARLANAALNLLMNRPLNTPIDVDLVDSSIDEDRVLSDALVEQQRKAVEDSPEVLSLQHKSEAANLGWHAAVGEMLPEINAFFTYENTQGAGAMSPESQYYGGLVLSWNIWEWGATYYKVREAEARRDQARIALDGTRDKIRMDVETRRLELEEAIKSWQVAKIQHEQANENLRVEQARYEVQETTTTDLLSAQTKALMAENDMAAKEMSIKYATLAVMAAMGMDLLDEVKQ